MLAPEPPISRAEAEEWLRRTEFTKIMSGKTGLLWVGKGVYHFFGYETADAPHEKDVKG